MPASLSFLDAYNESILDNVVGSCPVQLLQYDAATLHLSTQDMSSHSFLKNQKRLYRELMPQRRAIVQHHAVLTAKALLAYATSPPDHDDDDDTPVDPGLVFDMRDSRGPVHVTSYDLASSFTESSPYRYALVFSTQQDSRRRAPAQANRNSVVRLPRLSPDDQQHFGLRKRHAQVNFQTSHSPRTATADDSRRSSRHYSGSRSNSRSSSRHDANGNLPGPAFIETTPTQSTLDTVVSTLPLRIPWLKYPPVRNGETAVILFNHKSKRKAWKRCLLDCFGIRVLNLNKAILRAARDGLAGAEAPIMAPMSAAAVDPLRHYETFDHRNPQQQQQQRRRHSKLGAYSLAAEDYSRPVILRPCDTEDPYDNLPQNYYPRRLPHSDYAAHAHAHDHDDHPVVGMGIRYKTHSGELVDVADAGYREPGHRPAARRSHRRKHSNGDDTRHSALIARRQSQLEDESWAAAAANPVRPLNISKKTAAPKEVLALPRRAAKYPEGPLPLLPALPTTPPPRPAACTAERVPDVLLQQQQPQPPTRHVASPPLSASEDSNGFSYLSPQSTPPSLTSSPSPSSSPLRSAKRAPGLLDSPPSPSPLPPSIQIYPSSSGVIAGLPPRRSSLRTVPVPAADTGSSSSDFDEELFALPVTIDQLAPIVHDAGASAAANAEQQHASYLPYSPDELDWDPSDSLAFVNAARKTSASRSKRHSRSSSASSNYSSVTGNGSSSHRPESILVTPQDQFDQELAQLAHEREQFSRQHADASPTSAGPTALAPAPSFTTTTRADSAPPLPTVKDWAVSNMMLVLNGLPTPAASPAPSPYSANKTRPLGPEETVAASAAYAALPRWHALSAPASPPPAAVLRARLPEIPERPEPDTVSLRA